MWRRSTLLALFFCLVLCATAIQLRSEVNSVVAPGGHFIPASCIHGVSSSDIVQVFANGTLLIEDGDNKILLPECPIQTQTLLSSDTDGWNTYVGWYAPRGTSGITSLNGTWTVPPAPSSPSSSATIFLFTGLEDSDSAAILQSVLQWGYSAAGGGSYWALAAWYVPDSPSARVVVGRLLRVASGDVIVTSMLDIGRHTWRVVAEVPAKQLRSEITVRNAPKQIWATAALETYHITQCSMLLAANGVEFRHVDVAVDHTEAAAEWEVARDITNCGQTATVLGTNTVELSWRYA